MSDYRGDLSPSDLADLASFEPDECKQCHGTGYVQHRGEPYAADPCGCRDPQDDEN